MRRLRIAIVAIAVAGGGCSAAAATDGPPAVDLDEFSVAASGAFAPGRNDLSLTNSGEFGHTVVVADATGRVIGATDVIPPGERQGFSLDLAAGTYEISCRIVVATEDGTLVDHYEEGMVTRIDVRP